MTSLLLLAIIFWFNNVAFASVISPPSWLPSAFQPKSASWSRLNSSVSSHSSSSSMSSVFGIGKYKVVKPTFSLVNELDVPLPKASEVASMLAEKCVEDLVDYLQTRTSRFKRINKQFVMDNSWNGKMSMTRRRNLIEEIFRASGNELIFVDTLAKRIIVGEVVIDKPSGANKAKALQELLGESWTIRHFPMKVMSRKSFSLKAYSIASHPNFKKFLHQFNADKTGMFLLNLQHKLKMWLMNHLIKRQASLALSSIYKSFALNLGMHLSYPLLDGIPQFVKQHPFSMMYVNSYNRRLVFVELITAAFRQENQATGSNSNSLTSLLKILGPNWRVQRVTVTINYEPTKIFVTDISEVENYISIDSNSFDNVLKVFGIPINSVTDMYQEQVEQLVQYQVKKMWERYI